MPAPIALIWLRRDLRLDDHAPFAHELHSLRPTGNHLVEREVDRLAALVGAIEDLAVVEPAAKGAVDVGFVGEAPPIFAQAAGAKFVYIGYDPAAPQDEAIVVPKDSALKSVADLKGRKVALNKGSNVHYLLVKALEKQGLKITDIQPVYLPPADARAERTGIDSDRRATQPAGRQSRGGRR